MSFSCENLHWTTIKRDAMSRNGRESKSSCQRTLFCNVILFSLCLKHALEAFMVMNSLLTNAKRNMPRAIHLDLQFHITTIKKN